MKDNGDGPSGFDMSLVHGTEGSNIASELIGQDDEIRKLFLTLSYFMDTNEANDFAMCLHKCDKHKLDTKKRLFLYMINARVGVKGLRSAQIVDVLTQIQKIEDTKMEKLDAKRQRGVKTPNV